MKDAAGPMTEPTVGDDELAARLRSGDQAALVGLYRRWQARVYRYVWRMSGRRDLAEDVTQESFLCLMRDASRFAAERGSLPGYLFGIARKQLLKRGRRERRYVALADTGERPGEAASGQDPQVDLLRREDVARVRAAVMALPPHYREAVILCDLEELAYADAAAALGCSIGTVRSRLSRARGLLLRKMRGREGRGWLLRRLTSTG
jgi:RNA polymerase sigma-70 factor (ECF subfamily)